MRLVPVASPRRQVQSLDVGALTPSLWGFEERDQLSKAATVDRWVDSARPRRAGYPIPCARPDATSRGGKSTADKYKASTSAR